MNLDARPGSASTVRIRTATTDDLPALVEIDDDATRLFAPVGIDLALPSDHPFSVNERERWRRSARLGQIFLAIDVRAEVPVGFAALGLVDGEPYLDQLSLRMAWMRRGIGGELLERARQWARAHGDRLWLTTYAHLPWNGPFYAREGFVIVPEPEWGPEIAALVAEQRLCLPASEQRIVMRLRLQD